EGGEELTPQGCAMHPLRTVTTALLVSALTAVFLGTPARAADSSSTVIDKIGGRNLDDWRKDLKDGDASARSAALEAIVQFGSSAKKAGPEVISVVKNEPDISVRVAACLALSNMELRDDDVPDAVRALRARVNDDQLAVRFQAVLGLARFGSDA